MNERDAAIAATVSALEFLMPYALARQMPTVEAMEAEVARIADVAPGAADDLRDALLSILTKATRMGSGVGQSSRPAYKRASVISQ